MARSPSPSPSSRSTREWSSALRPPLNIQPSLLPDADAATADDRTVAELLNAVLEGDLPRVKGFAKELGKVGKGLDDAVAAAPVGVTGSKRRGPLHLAAANGNVEICSFLMEACYVDAVDSDGATPLIFAIQGLGSTKVVEILVRHGANINKADGCGVTPLHIASERDLLEIAELLLSKKAEVDLICDNGGTPLHIAAKNGHVLMLKLLLQHKADYNKHTASFSTPMAASMMCPSLECLKILIEAGADVNSGSPATPLVIAAKKGLTDCIKCLLQAGADANIADKHGKLPIQIAACQEWRACVEVLLDKTIRLAEYAMWTVDGIIQHEKPGGLCDDLLETIFLCFDDVADLARASTVCTTFHRVISARRFLRRFRSLHRPPVLGLIEFCASGGFHPADPPNRFAHAARALALAADFSFSYIPNFKQDWCVCDVRDGRVLISWRVGFRYAFMDFIVCDPVHSQYIKLPPIPDNLVASAGTRGMCDFDPFLDAASLEDDLSFRVICAALRQDKVVILQFSSVTGKWGIIMVNGTSPRPSDTLPWFQLSIDFVKRHCAHGCFFWTCVGDDRMFMLDMREMQFAVVKLPPVNHREKAIVEAGGGMICLLSLGDSKFLDVYSKTLGNNDIDTQEWQYEKTLTLPGQDISWSILDTKKGCALLQATPKKFYCHFSYLQQMPESECYTVDLETSLVERLCLSNQEIRNIGFAYLYESLPPPLSPPSI